MLATPALSAIDIGTSKVCALIAVPDAQSGDLAITGWGESRSRGLFQGTIMDLQAVQADLAEAVQQAEAMAGQSIDRACVSLAGSHVCTMLSHAEIELSRSHAITRADMQQALHQARQIHLKENHQIIHTLAGLWSVDDQRHIRNPAGMHGSVLGVDTRIMTGSSTAIGALMQTITAQGINIEELVLSSLASAEATLTPEERQMGVALVDIGAGTTDLAIVQRTHVQFAGSIPMGGNDFTHDVASLLHCPEAEAEDLKYDYGSALPAVEDYRTDVTASVFGDQKQVTFSIRFLHQILAARAEQLWTQLDALLRHAGFRHDLPAGLVLTGGAAQLSRLRESCRAHFKLPVRTASIPYTLPIRHLTTEVRAPTYATPSGLLLWSAQNHDHLLSPPAESRADTQPVWRSTMRNILASFLPG